MRFRPEPHSAARFDMHESSRRRRTAGTIDGWLGAVGLGLALCSAGFAAVMVADRGKPKVFGLEHLAIFAQPNKSVRVAHRERALGPTPASPADAQLDTEPVGSIARDASGQTGAGARYDIISAQSDLVWLKRGDALLAATPGQTLPGLGLIASIDKRNGTWTLLGKNGEELLAESSKPSRARADASKGLILTRD